MSEAPPRQTLGLLDFLKDRSFQLFQARGTVSSVSYTLYIGTVLWLTYLLSGGIFLAGVVLGVQAVVFTLTFLFSPLVDRVYDKRWVFVLCYPVQAGLAAALGVTYAAGVLTRPLLLVIVVLLALLWDFTEAADETTTRLLFGKDHLFVISGLGGALGGGVSIAIYFTAGAAIAVFGVVGGFFFLAVLLALDTALALPLPIPTPKIVKQSWWSGLREGWALFRGEKGKVLRHLSVLELVVGFFLSAPLLLLTLYIGRFFASSQATYAELYVAYLVGGIVIGLILGHLNPRGFIGPVSIGAIFAMGLILLGAEVAVVSLFLSLVVWFVVGVANTARNQGTWIYLQGRFEPELLARVTMNIYAFTGIASAIGAFTVGVLSTMWSPAALTDLVASGFVASAALGFLLQGTRTLGF
ncbi:MAG: hypothetical protein L3J97_01695 [Thermoplasmata archaeon]|nr:hypothetical protein [Thermoplasmata archaeon]